MKFKIGDRVRTTNNTGKKFEGIIEIVEHFDDVSSVGYVIKIRATPAFLSSRMFFWEDDLQLVSPKITEDPKFLRLFE